MGSPEKLYLIQGNGLICYCRNNKDDIEYIRTDVAIEKTQNFFRQSHHLFKLDGMELSAFIEDFRKYIKGE
jgi:hypothetical protein